MAPGDVVPGVVGDAGLGVVVPGAGDVEFPAGGVVPGVLVLPGFVGVVSSGVGVGVVFGVVPGSVVPGAFGFAFVGAGVGVTVPEGGDTVAGGAVTAG